MEIIKKSGLLVSLLLLVSCSVFSPIKTQPEARYELKSIPPVAVAKRAHASTLMVMNPETNPPFNTTQMAYTNQPYQISYFAKSRWAATPAEMLQTVIVQTLQNTHYFHAVIQPPSNSQYSYALSTQVITLIQDFSSNPSRVRLTLEAQLTRTGTGRIIASKRFSIVEPSPQNSPYGGVIAANRASARMLNELTEFCRRSIR